MTSRIEQTKKTAFLTVLPKVSEQVSTTFGNIPSSSLRGVTLSAIGTIPARSELKKGLFDGVTGGVTFPVKLYWFLMFTLSSHITL